MPGGLPEVIITRLRGRQLRVISESIEATEDGTYVYTAMRQGSPEDILRMLPIGERRLLTREEFEAREGDRVAIARPGEGTSHQRRRDVHRRAGRRRFTASER